MRRDFTPRFADVSVIIAAYQAAGTIGRTLASIAAQTLKPKEVVVVDDGSTDGTRVATEACAPNMQGIRLKVFRTEDNRGAGAARNRAIAESSQPILAFLDADDEWLPQKLEHSLAVFDEGSLVLVAHDYLTGDGERQRHHNCERRFLEGADPFVQLYRKGYIASCSVVARRDAVITAGGFDEGLRNAQDFDLWLAILKKPGTRFQVFGEALLRYHPGPIGIMSHTRRRLRCGLVIAARYFPDLKRRPGSPYMSLWYRVAALHLEAVCTYGTRGEIVNLLLVAALLPFRLAAVTARCVVGVTPARGDGTVAAGMAAKTAILWVWVVAATATYLYQFRDFARPILSLLGLA
ncbi:MAG: glycosyltransferase family 2 protein [Rhodospirillales bacterium]|nr:glycosyltransferase family 2 protein [Rhodospirillales bacterium]